MSEFIEKLKKLYPKSLIVNVLTFFGLLFRSRYIFSFMDRPEKADDNAEFLYRFYVKKNQRADLYFILEKSSSDWIRLKRDNFNLIPYGGLLHIALYMNSQLLVSSHLPKYNFNRISTKIVKRLARFQFVFLQHGVTHNNISNILNRHSIHLLLTSTYREYYNFKNNSDYDINSSNVVLTGLPRFDTFYKLERKKVTSEILIMPTWRSQFTSHSKRSSKNFLTSQFRELWNKFIGSQRLKVLSDKYNYKVRLILHPELEKFVHQLDIPKYIDRESYKETSINQALDSSSLLVTDYSSVAFDMAVQHKPICYFQFDKDEFYSDAHLYRKCYFSYKHQGFGDICESTDALIESIEKILKNNGEMDIKFRERINNTFPFLDNLNSKRVAAAIDNITSNNA